MKLAHTYRKEASAVGVPLLNLASMSGRGRSSRRTQPVLMVGRLLVPGHPLLPRMWLTNARQGPLGAHWHARNAG
jgi:hypothetical protein